MISFLGLGKGSINTFATWTLRHFLGLRIVAHPGFFLTIDTQDSSHITTIKGSFASQDALSELRLVWTASRILATSVAIFGNGPRCCQREISSFAVVIDTGRAFWSGITYRVTKAYVPTDYCSSRSHSQFHHPDMLCY